MTKRQRQEIEFLQNHFGAGNDENEIRQFIDCTVMGLKNGRDYEKNSIFQAKRRLDMNVKMWTEDMRNGLLAYWELLDDFAYSPYGVRLVNSIRKNIKAYPSYQGLKDIATIGYLNSKHAL